MKNISLFLIFFIIINFSQLKSDEKSDVLKNKILKNVRCLICQGQSVYDSESDFALSIKLIVKEKINDGLSEDQIYGFLKEKYGDWVLFDPVLSKNTYILWLLPILLFLLGGAIIYKNLIIKKKKL
jgi:cytochrome c-type biogenesis protein CcmH|tara:strand:+ start:639 stop:1016 length:378 start_codon:yes stop_codon:yes gene_type:complete